jgi:hypothetical protein
MIRKKLSRTKGKRSKVKRSRYTGYLERGRRTKKKTSERSRGKTKKG